MCNRSAPFASIRVAALAMAAVIFGVADAARAILMYAEDNLARANHGTAGDRLIRFDSADPMGTMTLIGPTGLETEGITGLDFSAGGTLYATNGFNSSGGAFSGSKLYTINTNTGAATLVGSLNLPAGEAATDLSWNPVTNKMQALSYNGVANRLYTVDLASGAATLVGTITGVGSTDVGLSTNSAGVNFMHDLVSDRMYRLNGLAAITMSAALGFDTNFSQGMVINWRGGDEWFLGSQGAAAASSGLFLLNNLTGGVAATLATWPTNATTGLPEFETGDLAIVPEPASILGAAALAAAGLLARRRAG